MKRLLVALVLLIGVGGAAWWTYKQDAANAGKADPDAPPKILELKEADLKGLAIEHAGEPPITLEKDTAGQWSITAPQQMKADPSAVAGITAGSASLVSTRVVDPNVTDLAAYGLEPPALALAFTTNAGETKRLRIGADTADKSGVYAKLDDDPRLFTMATFNKTAFDKQLADLRDRHLLTFDAEKITSVTFARAGQPAIEFQRTGDLQWAIVKPQALRADGFQVDELVRFIHDAQLDPAADGGPFTSARPVANIRLNGAEGAMTLDVRTIAGQYFAKSSGLPAAYAVGSDFGMGVEKTLDDFRNAKLFDFGFDDPSKIQVVDTQGSRDIEKSGENWVSGGKTMDNIAVQNFIDKLRDLSASSFGGPAVTKPDMTILVVSNAGKRSETVQLQLQGGAYSAKRTDSPNIYSVDKAAVDQLRDALTGVREPPPADTKADKNK